MKKQPEAKDEKIIQKERQKSELKGIAALAAGIFLLAAYAGLPTGFAGEFSRELLRYGFGLGAVAVPAAFIAMGIGYFRMGKNILRCGWFWAATLFFVCLTGLLHHLFVPSGFETEASFLPEGGGLIGGMLTKVLHAVAGTTGAVILLIGGMLVGLVLAGKLSVAALSSKAGDRIRDMRQARQERKNAGREFSEPAEPAGRERTSAQGPLIPSGKAGNKPGSSPIDVYNRDEFSDYNEDVRKQSGFRKILAYGQKTLDQISGIEEDPGQTGVDPEVYVPPERMANHDKTAKEKVPLGPVYPEKQETVVLRPASGIITGHTDSPQPAPWEKTAMLPGQDAESIPVSHYGEADGVAQKGDGPDTTLQPAPVPDGSPRFVLTPNGVMKAAEGAAVHVKPEQADATARKKETKLKAGCKETGEAAGKKAENGSAENPNPVKESDEAPKKEEYILPPLDLLNPIEKINQRQFDDDVREQCRILENTLKDFRVNAKVTGVTRGPSVTRYELEPAPGVKVSSVVNLADDIALRLAAPGVRVEAPIPGKAAIGIEAPNTKNDMVSFREIVDCKGVRDNPSKLCVGLGKDIEGKVITIDISKMPHMLVAGTTGSGKSVCVNTLLAGILYKARPDEVKLILVDPKVVELTNYNGIPHLLVPVVTDAKKAASALHWAVAEMERRYKSFADTRVRDIKAYNAQAGEKMPYIVIVIDEMSDLMMVAKADVEDAILRLAQKARACGIHMVLATQRPSVDVITGIVKANIPSRIAFAVSSLTDSRTILDMGGAEKLLGKGDMLFYPIGANKPLRVQGAFVSDEELNRITDFIKQQAIPVEYSNEVTNVALPSDSHKEEKAAGGGQEPAEDDGQDELLDEAIRLVLDLGQASSSMLQRRFRIGYNRAARLVDTMEELGIVGPAVGSKPRELRLSREEVEKNFLTKDSGGTQGEGDTQNVPADGQED